MSRDASRADHPVTVIARKWCTHLTVSALVGVAHFVSLVAEETGRPAPSWVDNAIGAVARWGYR